MLPLRSVLAGSICNPPVLESTILKCEKIFILYIQSTFRVTALQARQSQVKCHQKARLNPVEHHIYIDI